MSRESSYRDQLASLLGGKTEIWTPAGYVDVATQTEIIELKKVKQWKDAIGQILVYSHYFPGCQKKICLIGQATTEFKAVVQEHCDRLEITLEWIDDNTPFKEALAVSLPKNLKDKLLEIAQSEKRSMAFMGEQFILEGIKNWKKRQKKSKTDD